MIRCAICEKAIASGLSNAHGKVCGWRCAEIFNRRAGADYAWVPFGGRR